MNELNETKGNPRITKPGVGHPIGEFAETLGKYYATKNVLFYDVPLRTVVRIGLVAIKKNNGDSIMVHGIIPVTRHDLVTLIENDFEIIENVRGRSGYEEKVSSITGEMASIVLESDAQFRNQLPKLQHIYPVQMPIIVKGKLQLMKKGYDAEYYSWTPEDAPNVREDMTLDEAKDILDNILYKEFCFVGSQDRSNSIAGLLTPDCRLIYKSESTRTPLLIYIANRERAGKDYDAGITSIVYEGSVIEDPPISVEHEVHDDELRKKALSTLMMGRMRLHSSNNKGYLDSAILEQLITNETVMDRILGGNKMASYSNTLDISLSANIGLTYPADLARRAVFVNLFFAEDDPNKRVFNNPDLHHWVSAHRGDVLSVLYALIRNWYEKGMPPSSKEFTSFHEWMCVVGGILEAAGYDAPESNDILNATAGDSQTANMRLLYKACHDKFGERYVTKKELFDEFINEKVLAEVFPWVDRDKSTWRAAIGRMLTYFNGRILDDIRMEIVMQENAGRNKYRWVSVNTTLPLGMDNSAINMNGNQEVPWSKILQKGRAAHQNLSEMGENVMKKAEGMSGTSGTSESFILNICAHARAQGSDSEMYDKADKPDMILTSINLKSETTPNPTPTPTPTSAIEPNGFGGPGVPYIITSFGPLQPTLATPLHSPLSAPTPLPTPPQTQDRALQGNSVQTTPIPTQDPEPRGTERATPHYDPTSRADTVLPPPQNPTDMDIIQYIISTLRRPGAHGGIMLGGPHDLGVLYGIMPNIPHATIDKAVRAMEMAGEVYYPKANVLQLVHFEGDEE